jgi:hypothetical protein
MEEDYLEDNYENDNFEEDNVSIIIKRKKKKIK